MRIDRWLWAVRVTTTRSAATALCRAGHVRVNGLTVKPATIVRVGDAVRARLGERERVLEVVQLIDKRVGAPVAATCWVDHTPEVQREPDARVLARDRSAGRPTKRDRRAIDRIRGR
ncbi:MAG TPA: RNA-binding S4 domain-containing protein [Acidimicrobiales bacterium]|nr:RNA-binding S4 domain-containing protein [Acidimicrobiales bacterium]